MFLPDNYESLRTGPSIVGNGDEDEHLDNNPDQHPNLSRFWMAFLLIVGATSIVLAIIIAKGMH